jgi:O-antigen/teichoic acid export membrane protein
MPLNIISNLFRKTIVKDAASLGLGKVANLLVGFFSMLIYGIVFQKRQIALISLFEMLVNLVLSFGISWSTLGIIRFGKEEYLEKGTLNYTSTLRLVLVLPIVALSTFLLVVFADAVRRYIGTEDTAVVCFLIASIVLTAFHEHIAVIFTAVERHVCNAAFYLLDSSVRLFILILFYSDIIRLSAEMYIMYTVYASLFLAMLRIVYLKKTYLLPIVQCKLDDLKAYCVFVFPQVYGFAALYVINWVDVYFIQLYCNMDDLGAYQFVYSVFIKVASFAFIINNLFFPKLVAWKSQDNGSLMHYITVAPKYIFGVTFLIMLLACLIYKPVFAEVFDTKYVVAYSSFDLLLLLLPFQFATYTVLPILNAYDKVMFVQLINIGVAAANVIVDWALIRHVGIAGAAIGTFAAYALKLYLLVAVINRMFAAKQGALIVMTIMSLCFVAAYMILAGHFK